MKGVGGLGGGKEVCVNNQIGGTIRADVPHYFQIYR